ncbi:MAG TPA: hypothetical protein VH306_10475 [Gaiellaceae bacterium]
MPAHADTLDLAIFWLVVAGRLFLPLLIPLYPLPAILVCLVLDGVDQTIFQQYTNLDLSGYQGYDKALDVYYLSVAYLSTLRNWTNSAAFEVSRFLFYYRLAGVVAFELFHWRAILLIFPNTFEYFFIVYEAIRLRWDPRRLSMRDAVLLAAGIWIFVKLPQEYWIHVAKMDTTDTIAAHPWVGILGAAVVVGFVVVLRRVVIPRMPVPDYAWRVRADPMPAEIAEPALRDEWIAKHRRLFDWRLLEKICLVGFVCVIFAQIIPDVDSTKAEIFVGVAILITFDSLLGLWTARKSRGIASVAQAFGWLALANGAIVVVGEVIDTGRTVPFGNTLFFVSLLTLIVALYDWFEPFHGVRFQERLERAPPQLQSAPA